jgi:hypothetical protein
MPSAIWTIDSAAGLANAAPALDAGQSGCGAPGNGDGRLTTAAADAHAAVRVVASRRAGNVDFTTALSACAARR